MSTADDNTAKRLSDRDGFQTLQGAFNEEDFSITTATFLQGLVGRKISFSSPNATTDVVAYTENGTLLYELTLTYSDSSKAVLVSAERTA